MAKINSNYQKLSAGYLFPEIQRRVRNYSEKNPSVKVMKLGIGNTTEPLPPSVISGLSRGVEKLSKRETYTGYGEYHGELFIRSAIQNLYRKYGVELDPEEIFVSDGAKSDSGNLQSVFASDSIVAVQDPAYPVYVDSNVIAGRTGSFDREKGLYDKIVYMPCGENNGFFPDLPKQDVDIIYICSPNNPTGAVATKSKLKLFVDFALKHRALIFFDAAYSAFIQDPSLPRSIYEIDGAKECAIEINSFSKMAGFTGVRLGWSIIPFSIKIEGVEPGEVNRLWMRRQSTFFNGPSNIAQEGGAAALSEQGLSECGKIIQYYMNNARLIREGLSKIGLTVYGGINAPYVWLKTPKKMKSWDFFDKLLNEAHVVGTPGSGFGPSGEGFLRLSAFGHTEDIHLAVRSIQKNLRLL